MDICSLECGEMVRLRNDAGRDRGGERLCGFPIISASTPPHCPPADTDYDQTSQQIEGHHIIHVCILCHRHRPIACVASPAPALQH